MVIDPNFDMPLAFARQLAATYAQTAAIEALHASMAGVGGSLTYGQEELLFGPPPPPPPVAAPVP